MTAEGIRNTMLWQGLAVEGLRREPELSPRNKTYPRRALRHLCLSLVEGDSVAPECSVKRLPCAPVVLYHPVADDLRYSKVDISMV